MSQQVFERNVQELLTAIEACLKARLVTPGLLLLYAGIDIMAWLNRPESHADVTRSDFIEWVDNYLLPSKGLPCSAIDLFAARCSLIHSYSAESRLSREGQAKEVFYAWGTAPTEDFQELIDFVGTHSAVAVHIDQLFDALRIGVERFKQSLADDHEKVGLVWERADNFFSKIPYSGTQGT